MYNSRCTYQLVPGAWSQIIDEFVAEALANDGDNLKKEYAGGLRDRVKQRKMYELGVHYIAEHEMSAPSTGLIPDNFKGEELDTWLRTYEQKIERLGEAMQRDVSDAKKVT